MSSTCARPGCTKAPYENYIHCSRSCARKDEPRRKEFNLTWRALIDLYINREFDLAIYEREPNARTKKQIIDEGINKGCRRWNELHK